MQLKLAGMSTCRSWGSPTKSILSSPTPVQPPTSCARTASPAFPPSPPRTHTPAVTTHKQEAIRSGTTLMPGHEHSRDAGTACYYFCTTAVYYKNYYYTTSILLLVLLLRCKFCLCCLTTLMHVFVFAIGCLPRPDIFLLSSGRKAVRKISVPTLILYEIHHIAFTHAFMVTSRSPSG